MFVACSHDRSNQLQVHQRPPGGYGYIFIRNYQKRSGAARGKPPFAYERSWTVRESPRLSPFQASALVFEGEKLKDDAIVAESGIVTGSGEQSRENINSHVFKRR